ncbi:MAG: ABC transporter ATP-binding protein, partial [Oscillospiraceae bacterium]|nr:ABC transporter ATP-binding protein [Oscillospiraceae bacterium]
MSHNNKSNRKRPVGRNKHAVAEKPQNFKGTIKSLMSYLSVYKISLISVLILAAGSAVFAIVGPKLLGNVTNEVFVGLTNKFAGAGGIDFDKIASMLLRILGLYIISALFSYVTGWLMTGVAQKFTYRLRREIGEKIHKIPFSYFDSADNSENSDNSDNSEKTEQENPDKSVKPRARNRGEILSIITNDIDTLSQSLNQSVTQIITSVVMIIGVVVMMFTIDWIITLVTLIILPISVILVSVIVKISQKHFKNQQEYLGRINGQVEETFGALNIVGAFNAQEKALRKFDEDNAGLYKSAFYSQSFSGLMMPVMMFIGNLGYVAVAIVGGLAVINGRILPGDIQAFIQYTRQMTQPLAQIAQVSSLIQSTVAAAERVMDFLSIEEEGEEERELVIEGNVEFRNVRFGYSPDKIIINDFSAKVKAGQKIAIVGPTGAGKTTVIKLLMRFYDVNSGEILIDGVRLRDYDKSQIRKAFGMV